MSSVRAFLAIPLPTQLKNSIQTFTKGLQTQIPDARWIQAENLHITLHFFGKIEQETLEKIKVSVLSVKDRQKPFLVEVKGLGAFPSLQQPRTLWLDLQPKDQLRQLHEKCRKRLHQVGVVTETRPYSPHLTLGRLRNKRPNLTKLHNSVEQTFFGQFPVDRLILFESRLRPEGAKHIPLLMVNFDD